MVKPAYVTVEYRANNGVDTVTIEGWLTIADGEVKHMFITPSLDFDDEIIKIGVAMDTIMSIAPASSIREYGSMFEVGEGIKLDGIEQIQNKGKLPILQTLKRMGIITEDEFSDAVGDVLDKDNPLFQDMESDNAKN